MQSKHAHAEPEPEPERAPCPVSTSSLYIISTLSVPERAATFPADQLPRMPSAPGRKVPAAHRPRRASRRPSRPSLPAPP